MSENEKYLNDLKLRIEFLMINEIDKDKSIPGKLLFNLASLHKSLDDFFNEK